MGALTPGRPALRLTREHEHRLSRHPGIPVFCHRVFGPFRLQPPTVVPTLLSGLLASGLPDHIAVAALDLGPCVIWASPVPGSGFPA